MAPSMPVRGCDNAVGDQKVVVYREKAHEIKVHFTQNDMISEFTAKEYRYILSGNRDKRLPSHRPGPDIHYFTCCRRPGDDSMEF